MTDEPTPARAAARALLRLRPLRGCRPPRRGALPRLLRAVVAYDGTDWAGWQRQREAVSVAEMLEAALEAVTGGEVSLHAAGRTDAGVHADGQAVSIRTAALLPPDAVRNLCAMVLPASIRVVHVEEAPEGWNPQRDAAGKLYRYSLLRSARPSPLRERGAWRIAEPLDAALLRRAAAPLAGRHDFRAFRNDPGPERRGEDTVRTVTRIGVDEHDDLVRIDVEGEGFLYMMVRNVVAALVEAACGRRPPEWPGELLAGRDRRLGPPPAPPHGLLLVRVRYADGFGAPSGGTES